MKLAIFGDIHGEFKQFYDVYTRVKKEEEFDSILQLGDFGMWEHALKDWISIEEPMYFVRGNHEEYTKGISHNWNRSKWEYGDFFNAYPEGFDKYFGENMPIHLDGDIIELGGISICGVGGANSADKEWRISEQKNNKYRRKLGRKLWWNEESVNLDIVNNLIDKQPLIDIMISHDIPNTASNRIQKFQKYKNYGGDIVLGKLYSELINSPLIWLFGHHHDWTEWTDARTDTIFIGFPIYNMGYGILDTNTKEIKIKNF